MPVIVDTYIKDGETINVYESGAHYNVTRKHLVKAPESALITKENVHKFKEQLAEKKRQAIIRGAGRALEKSGDWSTPNAEDVAEALAEAITIKALNPDNPKQVDAARFILQEAGMAETQTKSNEERQQFAATGDALHQLVGILREAMQAATTPRDVIDGTVSDVTDTRNDVE